MAEVAAFAQVLTHTDILKPIQEQVRFTRARFGQYDLIDFAVLDAADPSARLVVVAKEKVETALSAMHAHPLGHVAATIGTVAAEPAAMIFLHTGVGGKCVLDMLVGDPLPRIYWSILVMRL